MEGIYEVYSPEETAKLAKDIAEKCNPGDVFALLGDLGVGKTVFTKGFGIGLGISEPVVSPTFTILETYDDGRLPLYHFDVYRIGDVEEMEEIGFEEYVYGQGVSLIEWANLIEEIMPKGTIVIEITKDLSKGLDYRKITITKSLREGYLN
ncbi:MAG: tRNA (adenosine(37)-N6)-threonylcarbamoyltransferase complex ATPase subunit type 1 TsaE [Lachnospiraceae bacterium]|nr:tRNA (adenosine(37)-N6)-threonylcarbamoyltransferase complex ATPase subunit type 1 TsaE [Lachnospiraceae bacterium]